MLRLASSRGRSHSHVHSGTRRRPRAATRARAPRRAAVSACAETSPEPPRTWITEIGGLWRKLAEQHRAIDESIFSLPDETAIEAAERRRDAIFDLMLDAQAAAGAARAETLGDAAVQAAVVMLQGEDLASNVNTVAEVNEIGRQIRRTCASILLAIVRAGQLDIEQFRDTDPTLCCQREMTREPVL